MYRSSVAHFSPDRLEEFIDVINANLQPMFMQIRKGTSEEDGTQHYALVVVIPLNVYMLMLRNQLEQVYHTWHLLFPLGAGEHG